MGITFTSLHLVPICKSSSMSEEFSLSLLVWCDICARKIKTNAQKEYLYPLLNYQRWSPSIALNAIINNKQMTDIDDTTRFFRCLKKKKIKKKDKQRWEIAYICRTKYTRTHEIKLKENPKKRKKKLICGIFLPHILFLIFKKGNKIWNS
jgi:hypothetical protein